MHNFTIMPTRKYLIAIATYKRPHELQRLLDSLERTVDLELADVAVVDNDPNGSAEETVRSHTMSCSYVVEHVSGIASARNRGLDAFTEKYHAIIFVDDDEWMDTEWFDTITKYADRTGADVVQGSVKTLLPDDAPGWILKGGFYQRPIPRTGTVRTTAATNNVLLMRKAWVNAGSPRFDSAFSETGGSDWDLFWTIHRAGAVIIYCAEAIAYEEVPSSRLSWKWLNRRYRRLGLVTLMSLRKHGEPLSPFVFRVAAASAVGVAQLLVDVLAGKGIRALPIERILRAVGVAQGFAGRGIYEYRR